MICKRAQRMKRNVVRHMRAMNDNVLHDELWKGRFCARMKSFHYRWYDDNSGVRMVFCFEFKDLKTGYTKDFWMDDYEAGAHNDYPMSKWWITMNNFIVDDCDVWKYTDRTDPNCPYNDKTVYRVR